MVIYKSKTGNDTKEFEALDFIASITSHIPNRNEQTVRYLGLCKALHKPSYAEFKIMLSNATICLFLSQSRFIYFA